VSKRRVTWFGTWSSCLHSCSVFWVVSPDLLCLAGNHEVLVRIWRWRRAWHPRHITVLVVFRGRDGCAAMCLPAFCSLSYLPCAYLYTEPLISLHQSHHPRGHQHWVHRLQVDYSEHGNFYY
jgi:hypothetical protein